MPRKNILAVAALFLSIVVSAQYKPDLTWGDVPNIQALLSADSVKNSPERCLLDENKVVFSYNEQQYRLTEETYLHRIVYVNSEDALNDYNKLYVPVNTDNDLKDYNVRVISPNGQAHTIGKDALQHGQTDQGDKYLYFAISGMEKGCLVDFYYLLDRSTVLSGTYLPMQSSMPIDSSNFELDCPSYLTFAFHSRNGYPEAVCDTSIHDTRVYKCAISGIPEMKDEPVSNSTRYQMGILYKLDANLRSGRSNFYNYGTMSQKIFEAVNQDLSHRNKKTLEAILDKKEIKNATDPETKARVIEDYLKSNLTIVTTDIQGLEDPESIMQNHMASPMGMTLLLYKLYKMSNISCRIILTCNRFNIPFDQSFESYAYLNDFLFYFPDFNKYSAPGEQFYRFGLVPNGETYNDGLFIKEVNVGDVHTGAGVVKEIPPAPASVTQQKMDIKTHFNEGMDTLRVNMKIDLTGYEAQSMQPVYTYVPEDQKKDFREALIKALAPDPEIDSLRIENADSKDFMVKPLIVNAGFHSHEYIDRAGPKILLKAGKLIGPQSEMYQDEKRKLPVENQFNREYVRNIDIAIPDGYKCDNPGALNMDVRPFGKADSAAAGFISSMDVRDGHILVNVHEYYNKIALPLSDYDKYRDVINASADFNKITLIFEKK